MTTPDERARAIRKARRLLLHLCRPGYRPTWTVLRRLARDAVKHFPMGDDHETQHDAELSATDDTTADAAGE